MLKFLYYITKNNNKLHILLLDESNLKIYGYIYLSKISQNIWEVKTVAAIEKNGVKMHDVAMDFIYPNYIISTRDNQIKSKEINIFKKYINRQDVIHESINGIDNDWYNLKFKLKNKINTHFENGNITIKYMGIKFFNSLYDFNLEN